MADLGATRQQLASHRRELYSIFNNYLCGLIKDHDFRAKFKALFPNVVNDANLDAVWNAACHFDEQISQRINNVDELTQKGITVYTFGEISPIQINYFKEKYRRPIPGVHFFTCERLGRGNELLNELFNYINVQHPNIYQHSIALFHQPPAPLSLFQRIINWFLSLFNFWHTITTELVDEQKPYRSILLPMDNQETLQQALQKELQWDFTSKSKERQVASGSSSHQSTARKKRRKPSDPSYNPLREPEYSSSDEGYLPLKESKRDPKRARSHFEESTSSPRTGFAMRKRG